jgi:Flp pilus assembly protein TadG
MTNPTRTPGPRPSAEPLESGTRLPRVSRRGRIRREEGAAAVEFAIVATLFFMLVFGIIDFGFAFHSWNNAANAAREGARRAAVDSNVQNVKDRVTASAQTLDLSKLTVDVTCSVDNGITFSSTLCGASLDEGDIVRVSVDYAYSMITPIGSFVPGLGSTMNLHSQSESRFEGQ